MRVFERRDRLFSRHRRERVEKLVDIMSTLEVVKEIPQRNTGAHEHGSSAQDFRVAMQNRISSHETSTHLSTLRLIIYPNRSGRPNSFRANTKESKAVIVIEKDVVVEQTGVRVSERIKAEG
jgi:hypothetical protein